MIVIGADTHKSSHTIAAVDAATGVLGSVRIELTLPPSFPEKYRPAIVKAVSNCKVKRTIAAAPAFDVVLAVDQEDACAGA